MSDLISLSDIENTLEHTGVFIFKCYTCEKGIITDSPDDYTYCEKCENTICRDSKLNSDCEFYCEKCELSMCENCYHKDMEEHEESNTCVGCKQIFSENDIIKCEICEIYRCIKCMKKHREKNPECAKQCKKCWKYTEIYNCNSCKMEFCCDCFEKHKKRNVECMDACVKCGKTEKLFAFEMCEHCNNILCKTCKNDEYMTCIKCKEQYLLCCRGSCENNINNLKFCYACKKQEKL